MNVFHAGDGNLHPLLVFDAREPGIWDRVHAAGDAIVRACVEAGGVLSGEHGIGLEKRDFMPLVFTADDLDAQARLRDAFDPAGPGQPAEDPAAREPVRRDDARARGRVGVSALDEARRTSWPPRTSWWSPAPGPTTTWAGRSTAVRDRGARHRQGSSPTSRPT